MSRNSIFGCFFIMCVRVRVFKYAWPRLLWLCRAARTADLKAATETMVEAQKSRGAELQVLQSKVTRSKAEVERLRKVRIDTHLHKNTCYKDEEG